MAVPKRVHKPMPIRGLNSSLPGDAIGPQYASDALNVRFRFGEARPAPGRGLFDAAPVNQQVQRVSEFGLWSSGVKWPFMLTLNKLYRRGDASPFDSSAWFEVMGTLVPGGSGLWSWTSGESHLFFCRGVDSIMEWDGDPAHQFDLIRNAAGFEGMDGIAGNSPSPFFVEYFADRLVCANVLEQGVQFANRLRWPQSGDFRKWNQTLGLGAGFLDLPLERSEGIEGMGALGDTLAVYGRRTIASVTRTGTVDPALVYTIPVRGIGLLGPYTLGKANQSHFFLGHDINVWMWDGIQVQAIGDPVWKQLQQLVHPDAAGSYFGFVAHKRHEYWLVLADPTRGSFDAFVFDWLAGAWSHDTFPSLTAADEIEVPTPGPTWLQLIGTWAQQTLTWAQLSGQLMSEIIGGRNDGSTMTIDEASSYDYFAIGSIMDCFLETEDMYTPEVGPWWLQEVLRVILIYDPGQAGANPYVVELSFDQGRSWTSQQVQPSPLGYNIADFIKTGQLVRYRFREKDANVQFRWRSYGYQYVVSGDATGVQTA